MNENGMHRLGLSESDTSAPPVEQVYDLEALKLGATSEGAGETRLVQTSVALSRPGNQVFFLIHPDPNWRMSTAVITLTEDRTTYVVAPSMRGELSGEWQAKMLVSYALRHGGHGLWPIRLPGEDGRLDRWNQSAMEIVRGHSGKWIRVQSNRNLGCYEAFEAINQPPAPQWPAGGFDELMQKAIRHQIIDSVEHPVVRRLRGEI